MADKKITQLPSASIATGSNVLPIVQDGATEQITVTNLGSGILNLGLPVTASTITATSKYVFANSVINENNLGQRLFATDSNIFYQYAGTGGFLINNQGNTSTLFTLTNTGNLSVPAGFTGSLLTTGDITPSVSKSFSLGSVDFPFKDIFISSGSLNIASDTPGAPSTTLSNVDGNILISAGGMQLVGSGSFNAATGSFQYISGSMKQVGNYTQIGDHQTTGSVSITGSGFLNGKAILTSADTGSFYTSGNFGFYGNFYSTQSQTNPIANISQSLPLETNAGSDGVSVVSGSRLTVANPGVYNLQFSTQFEKTDNGTDTVFIWFKKNGGNVANSATALDITKQAGGGGKVVAAWNFIDQLSANDYLEIVWQSSDTTVSAYATTASGNIPAIPSTIATLTQVS